MEDQYITVISKPNVNFVKSEIAQSTDEISQFFIIKNLVCIGLAFVINFTASNALATLQSSINSAEGLGTASLSVFYASMVISCMFFPTFIIKNIGCKWTMAISILGYSSYIAANFKPTWATMIPAAILQGFTAGPLWSAKCVYLTHIAKLYAVRHKTSVEETTYTFFGIFFTMFESNQIWGNLVSTMILEPSKNGSVEVFSKSRLGVCGNHYCNEDIDDLNQFYSFGVNSSVNSSSDGIPSHEISDQLRLLIFVYLGLSLFASLFIAIFVSQIPETKSNEDQPMTSSLWLTVATFRQLRHRNQLFLIPLTLYRGLGEAFDVADFTKAFITCPLGIHNVGLVAICGGIVASVFAFIYGFLIPMIGRVPVFLFASSAVYASIFAMMNVHPSPDRPLIVYMMDCIIGLGEGCWQSQISAMYSVLFFDDKEAAFSSFRLFDSIGLILGYCWHPYMCIEAKLWIVTGFFSVGLIGYLAVELNTYFKSKSVPIGKSILRNPNVTLISYKSAKVLGHGSLHDIHDKTLYI